MGRLVQLSILGKGQEIQNSISPQFRYRKANYDFGNGFEVTTPLFAVALWKYLVHAGKNPDALLLLGTSGSTWGQLCEAIPENDWTEQTFVWAERAYESFKNNDTTHSMLDINADPLNKLPFSSCLAIDIVPECRDNAEIVEFCKILMSHLQPDDRLILDITHGYRHLPVLMAFLTTSLRWLRSIKVEDVYYGALEMGQRENDITTAPVINLRYAAQLFDMGACWATYEISGRYGELGDYFPTEKDDIILADYYENLTQVGKARSAATRLKTAFRNNQQTDSWLQEASEKLAAEWEWATQSRLHERMLAKARDHFQHGEYFKSITMLCEAFNQFAYWKTFGNYIEAPSDTQRQLMHQRCDNNLAEAERDMFHQLRGLRNVLVHGHHSNFRRATELVNNRQSLQDFLTQAFGTIENLFTQWI